MQISPHPPDGRQHLSLAVFPQVMFTPSKAKMGGPVAPRWRIVFAGLIAIVIAAPSFKLLFDLVAG